MSLLFVLWSVDHLLCEQIVRKLDIGTHMCWSRVVFNIYTEFCGEPLRVIGIYISFLQKPLSEEFELTANSLSALIETHIKLILRTFS